MKLKQYNLKFYSYSCVIFLMLTAGLWNWLLGKTQLAAWKQMLVLLIFYIYVLSGVKRRDMNFVLFFIFGSLILISMGLLNNMSLKAVFLNVFFYTSWIPFYLMAAKGYASELFVKHKMSMLLFLIVSAMGLIVDIKTDYFNFLANRDYDNYFLETIDSAKRGAFIFTTSTFIMPIFGMIAGLLLHSQPYNFFNNLILICCCIVGTISSGSLAAAIMLLFVLLAFFVESKRDMINNGFIFVILISLLFFYAENIYSIFDGQISRIFTNNSASESNTERLMLWRTAMQKIMNFGVLDHLFGLGLGVTNDKFGGLTIPHGESSLFQAYLEAGILGLTFRVVPFILIFSCWKYSLGMSSIAAGYLISIFVAPIFGNITSQILLGSIAGLLIAHSRKSGLNK